MNFYEEIIPRIPTTPTPARDATSNATTSTSEMDITTGTSPSDTATTSLSAADRNAILRSRSTEILQTIFPEKVRPSEVIKNFHLMKKAGIRPSLEVLHSVVSILIIIIISPFPLFRSYNKLILV